MKPFRAAAALLFLWASAAPAVLALGPQDVYILVNKNVADSQAVADYYCAKRGVPKDHVVALDLPAGEDIGRADYDAKLAGPLRSQLKDKRDKVKVLLTVYGVPLRVGPKEPNADEKAELEKVKKELEPLEKKRKELDETIKGLEAKVKDEPKGEAAAVLIARRQDRAEVENQIRPLESRKKFLSYDESTAAVDSELALLWFDDYDLRRWQLNLLYFQVPEECRKDKPPMLMTCRLDGPSVELVKRIIDQSLETEAKGLDGKVYVDARGIKYNPADDPGFGYGGYDESMRETAKLLEKEGKMSVTLDDKPELFAPGSCPDCASIAAGTRSPTMWTVASSSPAPWPGTWPVRRRCRCATRNRSCGARTCWNTGRRRRWGRSANRTQSAFPSRRSSSARSSPATTRWWRPTGGRRCSPAG